MKVQSDTLLSAVREDVLIDMWEKFAKQWLVNGGNGHEDGEDGLRALTITGKLLPEYLGAFGKSVAEAQREADCRSVCGWCRKVGAPNVKNDRDDGRLYHMPLVGKPILCVASSIRSAPWAVIEGVKL